MDAKGDGTVFDFEAPTDKQSIIATLEGLDREIGDYFEALSLEEFFADQGEHWSPCGHLVHLNKSMAAVIQALKVPRLLLALRFGRTRDGSADFDGVVQRYLAALDGGVQAGRFGPSDQPDPLPPEARRGKTLGRWRRRDGELRGALHRWSEEGLDRYQVAHPAMGKMTLREVLFFTAYHNAHHARRVHERRSGPVGEA